MTQDEAIAKIQALGITLDGADVNELKAASEAQLKAAVSGWLDVVAPAARSTTLSEIVKILQQVPGWVQLAVKIAGALSLA